MGGPVARDLRDFYSASEVASARAELGKDDEFQKKLRRNGVVLEELFVTTYPLKYLGIELADRGRKPRFPLVDALRIAVQPRSMDGASTGLRVSPHRRAFIEHFPDVDALLSGSRVYEAAPRTPLGLRRFKTDGYAALVRPALVRLEEHVGIPVDVSLEVLRKGLAAYKNGHRPGMSAHGWARARLSSFTFRGCTHFFPDHLLVEKCPPRTRRFWAALPCLCRKRSQCDRYGVRTASNA
tara:strand:- start:2720 stop:3436 length:717 start_codon:yes stop_codon:yes gene_type:complete